MLFAGWAGNDRSGIAISLGIGRGAELFRAREGEDVIAQPQAVIEIRVDARCRCGRLNYLGSISHRVSAGYHVGFPGKLIRIAAGGQAECKKECDWSFHGKLQRVSIGGTGLKVFGPV